MPWISTSRAKAADLPMSIDSISASSAALASIRSARRWIIRSRSAGLAWRQAPPSNWARAACTARSRSWVVPMGMRVIRPSVDGSMTSEVCPSLASTHWPAMNIFWTLPRKVWVASLTPYFCRYCLTIVSIFILSARQSGAAG
ncbi:hypothetical protein D3C85_1390320 [compost metagenome]